MEVSIDCSADVLWFEFVFKAWDVTFASDFVLDVRVVCASVDEVFEFVFFAKVSWVVFNEGTELEEVVVRLPVFSEGLVALFRTVGDHECRVVNDHWV